MMYEENLEPLTDGDASVVFAQQLAEMKHADHRAPPVTPESVVRWADKTNQARLAAICRRLLLPGSGIAGIGNLESLVALARRGNACLLCLNHRGNLDVPTLFTLIQDQADPSLFDSLIWIAGRKLEEDVGMTSRLVQCVHRLIVTPHSWFDAGHSDEECRQARRINIAAERAMARLRTQGWVFALFPSGTRFRPDHPSTRRAIDETSSYLKTFQYMLLCHIKGCTLPVSKDRDMTREKPALDRIRYTFGQVQRTEDWLAQAAARYPALDRRDAAACAITEDIDALSPDRQPTACGKGLQRRLG